MFKKLFVLIFLSFFLFSCWSSDKTTVPNTSWLVKKETKNISIEIPSNWSIIEDQSGNILPQIKNGEIELAITADTMTNWFANNLLILSDNLDSFTTSKDFSMLNNIWAQTDYLDYININSKEFKFLDEELSMLYIFQAKYNLNTPTLKFLQTAHVCNQNKAYFITLALPTTITDTAKYEEFLATFTCK